MIVVDCIVDKHEVFVTAAVSIWWPTERKRWNSQKVWGKCDGHLAVI